jgi:hypothetical protein
MEVRTHDQVCTPWHLLQVNTHTCGCMCLYVCGTPHLYSTYCLQLYTYNWFPLGPLLSNPMHTYTRDGCLQTYQVSTPTAGCRYLGPAAATAPTTQHHASLQYTARPCQVHAACSPCIHAQALQPAHLTMPAAASVGLSANPNS